MKLFNPLETASEGNLSYMNRTTNYFGFRILGTHRRIIASENSLTRNLYGSLDA
jgi:hypothetical protein